MGREKIGVREYPLSINNEQKNAEVSLGHVVLRGLFEAEVNCSILEHLQEWHSKQKKLMMQLREVWVSEVTSLSRQGE